MNDIELFAENELTPIESEERAFHEKVIHDAERGKQKLTEIQLASLKVLFDNKLYRSTHKTFPEYCKATFDFEKAYSYFQIGFAQVKENLSTRVDFLPATEGQARPLTKLPTPELQAQAWQQAQADSGKEQPSNREVAEAVAKIKALETCLTEERQRGVEWREQDKANRKKIEALELSLLTVKSQPAPKPEVKEVIPADYKTAKAEAARLQAELANLKKEQDRLVNAQLKAKLNERARELEEMERRKTLLEEQVARMTAYMASLDSEADRIEVHRNVIEKNRLSLIDLAAFLGDADPISDAEILKRWRALADMLAEAMSAVRQFSGDHRPELTVIRGDAA